MELDTGAEVSVLPESTYLSLFPEKALIKSAAILKTYTGESIPMIGEVLTQKSCMGYPHRDHSKKGWFIPNMRGD